MHYWVLPPKRFESIDNPKYDPIRVRPWFSGLAVRRARIPRLEQAFRLVTKEKYAHELAALQCGVSRADLKDYYWFRMGASPTGFTQAHQYMMNSAYPKYCEDNAKHHIGHYLAKEAPLWGDTPGQVREYWEIDPTFWPDKYPFL